LRRFSVKHNILCSISLSITKSSEFAERAQQLF
jgi:hypothetical protein